jgi:lipopolysaccharide/colanic/teichoic acid biosynthesis glycosyltransferase
LASPTIFVSPGEIAAASKHGRLVTPRTRVQVRQAGRIGNGGFHVLNQDLFADAVSRERKRADRFEQPFVLVLFSFNGSGREWGSKEFVKALSQSSLDTDVIGWFEQDTVLGLVRPLLDAAPRESALALADRVRRELTPCLTLLDVKGCSIQWDVYSPASGTIPSALVEADIRKPRQVARDAAKRVLDILGSSALLIALAPLFALVAALVKLTSNGPVLFPQERIGTGGKPFRMMKFRTMHVNADPRIHQQYVENFIQSSDASGSSEKVFKIVNDPRVTPIGHFLRRMSLDELPQFWNVLNGEMSLVGPRPPLPYEVARYKSWHRRRVVEAKPGITGLWQVTGRSRTTFDEMVRLDLRYARSYSVWTDLKILMATPRAVISGKGAH